MDRTRLWVDDQRKPPDESWDWGRTFLTAVELLITHGSVYDEFSLDHDLGEHEPTGFDFLRWVVLSRPDLLPRVIRIHSANPVGAANMKAVIERSGLYPKITMYGTGFLKGDL